MYNKICVVLIFQIYFLGTIRASVDSCYYCSGTRACTDPMDHMEVSPRDCTYENNSCIKYISTTKNRFKEIIGDELTYRKCYPRFSEDEDICGNVKEAEISALAGFNYTLAAFECYVCNETNCNTTPRRTWTYLWWISLILTLYALS